MTTMLTKQFRVFRDAAAAVDTIGPSVLALAGFDGVHTGHRALLGRAADEAATREMPVGAVTFDRGPDRPAGQKDTAALTGLAERLRLLREAGMDFVVSLPASRSLGGLLTNRVRLDVMKAQIAVVRRDPGSAGALAFEPVPVRPTAANSWVSTTRIRERLSLGDIETANDLLGRRYEITATVKETGRGWLWAGTPAARVRPAPGAYRVLVRFGSGGLAGEIESVATVTADGTDLILPLEVPVDHGRLRIGFLARCATVNG